MFKKNIGAIIMSERNYLIKTLLKFKKFTKKNHLGHLIMGGYMPSAIPIAQKETLEDRADPVLLSLYPPAKRVLTTDFFIRDFFDGVNKTEKINSIVTFWYHILSALSNTASDNLDMLCQLNAEAKNNFEEINPTALRTWLDRLIELKNQLHNYLLLLHISMSQIRGDQLRKKAAELLTFHWENTPNLHSQMRDACLSPSTSIDNLPEIQHEEHIPLHSFLLEKLKSLSRNPYKYINMHNPDSYHLVMQRDKLQAIKDCLENNKLTAMIKKEVIQNMVDNCYDETAIIKKPFRGIEDILKEIILYPLNELEKLSEKISAEILELENTDVECTYIPARQSK